MIKVQKETGEYILYSPDSLKYITDKMDAILDSSIAIYKKLFDIERFRKVQINYFDNIDDFRGYIYHLRGEKESLPSYAKGTFDEGMINAFIEPNWLVGSPMYIKKLYLVSHELFHIMYQELVWNKENKPRIVWFDEGMAQYFSGEYNYDLSNENFENWFKTVIKNTKMFPNLNEFETENYSGYRLSLLAVKYLYDKLSIEEFKKLMHNTDGILRYGSTVLNDAISYYNDKYKKLSKFF